MQKASEGSKSIRSANGAPRSIIKLVPTDKVIKKYRIQNDNNDLDLKEMNE